MSRSYDEKKVLDMFASMHLVCIEKQETPSEKMSRYLLEKLGYIDAARARLGGEYSDLTSNEKVHELKRYYESQVESKSFGSTNIAIPKPQYTEAQLDAEQTRINGAGLVEKYTLREELGL